jgi:glycosyltransferase involved in cell wall biosynthesis
VSSIPSASPWSPGAPPTGTAASADRAHIKVLFVVPDLPRPSVSVCGIARGTEALSGSHVSFLLVADHLARRGHEVGIYIRSGDALTETHARPFGRLESALAWVGDGRVVLCTWDEPRTADELKRAGIRPLVWLEVDVSRAMLRALEANEYEGLLVVSDTTRLTSLRSRARDRIGRVYNPVNPFFGSGFPASPDRYASGSLVSAGYFGESKGVHRLLAMWPKIRAARPSAVLSIAGSSRLYSEGRPVGSLGLADPAFEEKYLLPLVRQFGSLEAAGGRPVGLLSPDGLRALYSKSALGVLNMNWDNYIETYSCAAVEMLATELPVFGVAAGALPETVGRSGGAVLASTPDLGAAADEIIGLLDRPDRLAELGRRGREFVLERYSLKGIGETWERLLRCAACDLASESGGWNGKRGLRYWIEWTAGAAGLGRVLDQLARWLKGTVEATR